MNQAALRPLRWLLSCLSLWAAAPALALTAGAPIALPTQAFEQHEAAVAFGGGVYLVVWQSEDGSRADIYGARLSSEGALLDASPLALSTAVERQKRPRVSFSNGVFLVVWEDLRSGVDYDVYGCRVRPDGTVLDPAGIAIATGERNQAQPDVAGGPDRFVVVHQRSVTRGYVPEASVVGTNGAIERAPQLLYPLPSGGGIVPGSQVRVSFADDGYLVAYNGAWTRSLNGDFKISGQRLAADATPVDALPFDVSNPSQRIYYPNVAPGPSGWLVVWEDIRERGENGFAGSATRVAFDGTVVDADPNQLTFGINGRKTYHNTVAHDGTRWVVAFVEPVDDRQNDRLYWKLVSRVITVDGDDSGDDTLVAEDAGWPTLASDGSGKALLVYTQMATVNGERMKVVARFLE